MHHLGLQRARHVCMPWHELMAASSVISCLGSTLRESLACASTPFLCCSASKLRTYLETVGQNSCLLCCIVCHSKGTILCCCRLLYTTSARLGSIEHAHVSLRELMQVSETSTIQLCTLFRRLCRFHMERQFNLTKMLSVVNVKETNATRQTMCDEDGLVRCNQSLITYFFQVFL